MDKQEFRFRKFLFVYFIFVIFLKNESTKRIREKEAINQDTFNHFFPVDFDDT